MITIKNKKTGHTQEVTREQWDEIKTRSRYWEAVRTEYAKPPKAAKKAKAEPEPEPLKPLGENPGEEE